MTTPPWCRDKVMVYYCYFLDGLHVKRIDEYRMARRVLMAEVSGGRVRGR